MLTVATADFTVFFAVWVMFAIVGIPLRKELGLSDGEFAFLVAIPILTGSLLRVPVGLLTDHVGGRKVMTALLVVTSVPAFLISHAHGYHMLVFLAFLLGIAGTSFAAGIAWVAAWFPHERQGFALGTFGAGNVGASITKLIAPTLVTAIGTAGVIGGFVPGGWRFVPFTYGVALLVMAVVTWTCCPKVDPRPGRGRTLRELVYPLRFLRVWRFGLYYLVVFGAYVALSLWLPKYYVDVYGFELHDAGFLTALFIFPASLLRPVGGHLSDRFGARVITYTAFIVMCGALAALSFKMRVVPFTALMVLVGVTMGLGKASVYKYISDYFPRDVGAVGGLVGSIGGLGGFVLPLLFAWTQSSTGRPQSTFLVLLLFAVTCLVWLHVVVVHMLRHPQLNHPSLESEAAR